MKEPMFIFEDNEVQLNKHEILLIPQFGALWEINRNKCPEDKTGKFRLRAYKEFKYIWLAYDYKSDYMELNDNDRIKFAVDDSGLTLKDIADPLVVAAAQKYIDMRETKLMRLLKSSYKAIDELRDFFTTLNLKKEDAYGKMVYNVKDVIYNLSNLGKVIDGIQTLEYQVKKEMEKNPSIRGDATPGFFDDK